MSGAAVALHIAGRPDDVRYAKGERIADLMAAHLPDVSVTKHPIHPDEWGSYVEQLRASLGLQSRSALECVVWTDTGRLVGDQDDLEQLALREYGIELDLDEEQLRQTARQNFRTALTQQKSRMASEGRTAKRALIVVDVQNDFCEGGSLAVPCGSEVIAEINAMRKEVSWDLIVLTQDFHPPEHISFASNNEGAGVFETRTLDVIGEQVMWPDHCVQGTPGAEFHPNPDADVVVQKGKDKGVDSYSGFGDAFEGKYEKTELERVLREAGIEETFVCGLALDYCVGFTSLDSARVGFKTFCLLDASRGIAEGSIGERVAQMEKAGVVCVPKWRDVLPTS